MSKSEQYIKEIKSLLDSIMEEVWELEDINAHLRDVVRQAERLIEEDRPAAAKTAVDTALDHLVDSLRAMKG
jgi:predicted metal-dependent enzyme (double-stranded beta helix superfamily)